MNFFRKLLGLDPPEKKPCVHQFRQSDVYACTFARLYDKKPDYPAPRCIKCGAMLDMPEV